MLIFIESNLIFFGTLQVKINQMKSHIARYSAIKTYTDRRLQEVFENATKFVAKISLILADDKKKGEFKRNKYWRNAKS